MGVDLAVGWRSLACLAPRMSIAACRRRSFQAFMALRRPMPRLGWLAIWPTSKPMPSPAMMSCTATRSPMRRMLTWEALAWRMMLLVSDSRAMRNRRCATSLKPSVMPTASETVAMPAPANSRPQMFERSSQAEAVEQGQQVVGDAAHFAQHIVERPAARSKEWRRPSAAALSASLTTPDSNSLQFDRDQPLTDIGRSRDSVRALLPGTHHALRQGLELGIGHPVFAHIEHQFRQRTTKAPAIAMPYIQSMVLGCCPKSGHRSWQWRHRHRPDTTRCPASIPSDRQTT